MDPQQLVFELQRGGKFVQYQYCVSAVVITFKRGTDIYLFCSCGRKPAGERAIVVVADAVGWLVGHSLGTDLHGSVTVGEHAWRARPDGPQQRSSREPPLTWVRAVIRFTSSTAAANRSAENMYG
jgi:hypothetical protein